MTGPHTGGHVLVTGASGVLGRAVAAELLSRGHRVRTFHRGSAIVPGTEPVRGSVTDAAAVGRAVEGVDAVVHLAAKVSFTGEWDDFVATNITGTRHLLDAARSAGVPDFVYVSSPSVAHHGASIVGEAAGAADPAAARGHYARSKAAAELLALAADGPGFRVAAVRPHIVWGPGDTQLVERVIDRARSGRLPLLDGGTALIDTTYVDNAAAAIVRSLERIGTSRGRPLVVTNGEPRPVGELISGICAAGGVPAPRFSVPGSVARIAGTAIERAWVLGLRRGWVHDEPPMTGFLAEQLSTAHWFDQRATRDLLDWKPAISLDEGLSRLAAYYGGVAPSMKRAASTTNAT